MIKVAHRMDKRKSAFLTTSKAERYSAHKTKLFHREYDEKVFIIFWALQTNFCNSDVILCMLNGCLVLVARKLLQSVTNK